MKYIKKLSTFAFLAFIFLSFAGFASASILTVPQGGSGVNSITGLIQGNGTTPFSPVTIGSGLSLSGSVLSNTGSSITPRPADQIWYSDGTPALTGDDNHIVDPTTGETTLQRVDGNVTQGLYTKTALPVLSLLFGQNINGSSTDYLDPTDSKLASNAVFLDPNSGTTASTLIAGDANGDANFNLNYDSDNATWGGEISTQDAAGNPISHITVKNGPGNSGNPVIEGEYSPQGGGSTPKAGWYISDDGSGNPTSQIGWSSGTGPGNDVEVSNSGIDAITPTRFDVSDQGGNTYINVDSSSVGGIVNIGDDNYAHNNNFSGVFDIDNASQAYGVVNFLQQHGSNSYFSINGADSGGEFTYGMGDLDDAHFGASIKIDDNGGGISLSSRDINIGDPGSLIDYVFPNAQATAAGDVLTNNGAGVLTWAPVPSSPTLTFADSLVNTGGTVTLVNDSTPSASEYYGTDGSGTLGYFPLSSFGLIGSTSGISNNPTPVGGDNEVWVGEDAGTGSNQVDANTFVGFESGDSATGSGGDVFMGFASGSGAANAHQAIFIGEDAGLNDTVNDSSTDASSIAIGKSSGTGGFFKTIALGNGAVNTVANQFLIQSAITNFDMRGINWTMPSAQGAANTALTNDGSGNLSWSPSTAIPGDLTGQTGAVSSVITATSPNDGNKHTYSLGAYLNVTSVTLDVVQEQVTYTDENGTSQTETFFPPGVTSGGIGTIGNSPMATMNIRVNPNTAITIKTILTTGTGSIAYDVGGTIQLLK